MNRNYNGLLVLFFVALLTSALFGGGPEPRIPVGSADIANGSVTPAKISSGYNLLTTAEKTQALVGSSTVDFAAKDLNFTNAILSPYASLKSISYSVTELTQIATITVPVWGGGELVIVSSGFRSGVGGIAMRHVFRVQNTTSTTVSTTSESWGYTDRKADLTAVAGAGTVGIFFTSAGASYQDINGSAQLAGGITAEWR